jgi:PhnB protein
MAAFTLLKWKYSGPCFTDPDALIKSAAAAGARVISPAQDYDYGYRQGSVADPFGHQWLIQKKI